MTDPTPVAPTTSRAWRIADGVAAALFALCAVVNLNDPDPVLWVLLYGLGTYASILDATGRLSSTHAGISATGYWILAGMIAWAGRNGSPDMKGFPQFGIFTQEMVREALGLALVAAWLTALAVRLNREDR